MATGRQSHAEAWARLSPKAIEVPNPQICYDAYQQALDAYWRGLGSSWDVLKARIAWCQAESRLVDARQRESTTTRGRHGRAHS